MRTAVRWAALPVAAAVTFVAAACAPPGEVTDTVVITMSIESGPPSIALWEALIEGFQATRPGVRVLIETRPSGGEGDNLVKTRLATGEMSDLFWYNAGSLLRALNPDRTLVAMDDEPWLSRIDEQFAAAVSTASGLYGAPVGTSAAGAVVYNKVLYEELELEVPRTWDAFMANNAIVAAAGRVPVVQTYGDPWTAQLLVLGDFHNVVTADPSWPAEYSAGNAKYADAPAFAGFRHLEELAELGYLNEDFASASHSDGVRLVTDGEAAHYPMLTSHVAQVTDASVESLGVFPIPGDDPRTNGYTVWMPNGVYIPRTTEGDRRTAAKDFVRWLVTRDSCRIQGEETALGGPFVLDDCPLPAAAPDFVADLQTSFDDRPTSLALEFVSPIKGPALEQITVEVGSGFRSARDGARLYDADVVKQAVTLGRDW